MPSTHHRSSQSQHPSAPTPSVSDNRLGLSPEDVAALRQHQQLAHAQARSPAGSQASSQGRLLLDPGSLQMLSRHLDRVMQAIGHRLDQLNQAMDSATQTQHDRAGLTIQRADQEMARLRAIMQQMDELDMEFDKIKRISEIVRGFRARVEQMERRLG